MQVMQDMRTVEVFRLSGSAHCQEQKTPEIREPVVHQSQKMHRMLAAGKSSAQHVKV